VRQKKPNQLGIFDLSGNLYEWVWNWYAPYSYRIVDQFKGPAEGTDKVIRGGSWYHPESEMRVSNGSFAKPFQKSAYLGFRVVRSSSTE
jgi:formylglycine-generating enzyme required for sulfatase activity